MPIPDNISLENIQNGIEDIINSEIPPMRKQRNYSLLTEAGQELPPKYVVSIANKYANGKELDFKEFNAVEAKKFLEKFKFNIIKNGYTMPNSYANIWVEKTKVKGRNDRINGERAFGKVIWSPKTGKDGRDTYKNMRRVEKGDFIVHFIDNEKFAGISKVASGLQEVKGLKGTEWERDCYLYRLDGFKPFSLMREKFLNRTNSEELNNISQSSEVFYQSDLNLRQGAYLTPAQFLS